MAEYYVYRGQYGESKTIHTLSPCITFTCRDIASIYAKCPNNSKYIADGIPRLFKAKITINNLFMNEPTDPFIECADIIKQLGEVETKRIALKFAPYIEVTDNWQDLKQASGCSNVEEYLRKYPGNVGKLYLLAYILLDDASEVALLKSKGFDGAIHGGSGVGNGWAEWKVFSPAQIEVTDTFLL